MTGKWIGILIVSLLWIGGPIALITAAVRVYLKKWGPRLPKFRKGE